MNIRDLRYLIAVAETHNFRQAAEQCHVSQPTLSMQIKKMEEYLGVILIERNTRQVMLTAIGKIIVQRAESIVNDIDKLISIARGAGDPYASELKIAIIPTLAPYLLPEIVPLINKKFPKLKPLFYEKQTHVCLEELQQGFLDCAILATPEHDESLASYDICKETFKLLVPADHKLAKKKSVSIQDVKSEEVLLLEDGHCFRDQTLEVCRKVDAKHVSNFKASSLETLKSMVATHFALSFIPELATKGSFKPTKAHGLVAIPIKRPTPYRQITLYWRKTNPHASVITECGSVFKEALAC